MPTVENRRGDPVMPSALDLLDRLLAGELLAVHRRISVSASGPVVGGVRHLDPSFPDLGDDHGLSASP
jgi:hypothetical protein